MTGWPSPVVPSILKKKKKENNQTLFLFISLPCVFLTFYLSLSTSSSFLFSLVFFFYSRLLSLGLHHHFISHRNTTTDGTDSLLEQYLFRSAFFFCLSVLLSFLLWPIQMVSILHFYHATAISPPSPVRPFHICSFFQPSIQQSRQAGQRKKKWLGNEWVALLNDVSCPGVSRHQFN